MTKVSNLLCRSVDQDSTVQCRGFLNIPTYFVFRLFPTSESSGAQHYYYVIILNYNHGPCKYSEEDLQIDLVKTSQFSIHMYCVCKYEIKCLIGCLSIFTRKTLGTFYL